MHTEEQSQRLREEIEADYPKSEQTKADGNTPQKSYIDKKSIKLGYHLYSCDVLTGLVEKVIIHKEKVYNRGRQGLNVTYSKRYKTRYYVMASNNLFFLTAKNLEDARGKFEVQFKEMDKQIKKHKDYDKI